MGNLTQAIRFAPTLVQRSGAPFGRPDRQPGQFVVAGARERSINHEGRQTGSVLAKAFEGFALGKDGGHKNVAGGLVRCRGYHGYATFLRPRRLREREIGGRTRWKGISSRIPLSMCRL